MATYLGVPYHAGLGPDGTEATLFSPGPPPDDLGFTAAAGHWRKQVAITDLDALWQSRLVGEYRGEPCLVLDDLGDRLHIVYLGRDSVRARQLGYWEIDREVFEVVVARHDITGLTEERVEYPLASAMFPASDRAPGAQAHPEARALAAPQAAGGPALAVTERTGPLPVTGPRTGGHAVTGPRTGGHAVTGPQTRPQAVTERTGPQGVVEQAGRASSTPDRMAAWHGSPEPWAEPEAAPPPGRPTARRDRVPRSVFAELLNLAAIPQTAYAVDEEAPGAMCLIKAGGGFEVFGRTDDARLDVRFFEDEEAAYFYLFGVLAAEAVRSGRLAPGRPNGYVNGSWGSGVPSAPTENVSKYLRRRKLPKRASRPAMVN
jgi:hypothetical protein